MTAENKDDIIDSFQEELDTLQDLYADEIKITIFNRSTIILFQMQTDETHIIQTTFTNNNNSTIISVSNHEKSIDRYSKKFLKNIQSKLLTIYKQYINSFPIYQCISYLNDSLIDDLKISNKHSSQKRKTQPKNEHKKTKVQSNEMKHKQKTIYKPITIYTWGNKKRKKAPMESQHNTNVIGVLGGKNVKGANFKKLTGKDEAIQNCVKSGRNYELYSKRLINKIVNDGLHTVSVNCQYGRHRSVGFAELLSKELKVIGYAVTLIHLEL